MFLFGELFFHLIRLETFLLEKKYDNYRNFEMEEQSNNCIQRKTQNYIPVI